ncbi:hypothetical protein [Streptomyces seoulensis]|uniref:hypothetical protein n=1 Tax=Streptomyces seoulensis TaxID=73044 RepID=UPI0033AE321C
MNDFGDAHLRTWALRFMTLLAADLDDQLAWLGEQAVEAESAVEEVLLLCRIWEGLVERGLGEPGTLREVRAIGRRLAEAEDAPRTGLWADELAVEPVWGDVRSLAARFLRAEAGDRRDPP